MWNGLRLICIRLIYILRPIRIISTIRILRNWLRYGLRLRSISIILIRKGIECKHIIQNIESVSFSSNCSCISTIRFMHLIVIYDNLPKHREFLQNRNYLIIILNKGDRSIQIHCFRQLKHIDNCIDSILYFIESNFPHLDICSTNSTMPNIIPFGNNSRCTILFFMSANCPH